MSRYLAWCRKEAREHRVVLAVLLAVVALGCATPFLVAKWELRRRTVDALPALAVFLATAVLGLDLFAREARQGTAALLLRTPGAMRAAFLAKWTWCLGGVLLAFLVAHATCLLGTAITGAPFERVPHRTHDGTWTVLYRDPAPAVVFGVVGPVLFPLIALALGAWHVVGSTWTRRGGAAALIGAFTLVALALPLLLLFHHHEWWFAFPPAQAIGAFVALAGAAVGIAALSWAKGRRFLATPRRAFAWGAGASAALSALLTGGVAWAIDRWEAEDPHAPEYGISDAYLGEGGRHLFLASHRGRPWGVLGGAHEFLGTERGTPTRLWRVDLRASGQGGDAFLGEGDASMTGWAPYLPTLGIPYVPVPAVSVPWVARLEPEGFVVVDARTGDDTALRIPRHGTPAAGDVLPYVRSMARAVTPFRDASGRRVAFLFGRVEDVEDDAAGLAPPPAPPDPPWSYLQWDGWVAVAGGRRTYVEAATGVRVALPPLPTPSWPEGATDPAWTTVEVDEDLVLSRGSCRVAGREVVLPWTLTSRVTGERRPAPEVLDLPAGFDEVLPLRAGRVLRADPLGLAMWRPATGEVVRPRLEPAGEERAVALFGTMTRVAGDRWLFTMATAFDPRAARYAVGLLDDGEGTVARLSPWSALPPQVVALEPDGALVAVEDRRRVVRYRAGGAQRTVLHPRP